MENAYRQGKVILNHSFSLGAVCHFGALRRRCRIEVSHFLLGKSTRARLEQGNDLAFGRSIGHGTKVNIQRGEALVVFQHEQEPEVHESELLEDDRAFFVVGWELLNEVRRVLTPVAACIEVVARVVAVVEGLLIVEVSDAGDAGLVVALGIARVDEWVLCPVAAHHTEAHDNQRDEEDKDAAKHVVVGGKAGNGERRDFASKRGKCVPVLRALDEIHRQFEGDEEEEAKKVLAKV